MAKMRINRFWGFSLLFFLLYALLTIGLSRLTKDDVLITFISDLVLCPFIFYVSRGYKVDGKGRLSVYDGLVAISCWVLTQALGVYLYQTVGSEGFDLYQEATKDSILFVVLTVVLAPIFEELFFRRFVYGFFREKFSLFYAACISSIFFAAIHGTIIHIPLCFFLGLLFCCLYEKTGKIWVPMILHGGLNLLGIVGWNPLGFFQLASLPILVVVLLFGILLYFCVSFIKLDKRF